MVLNNIILCIIGTLGFCAILNMPKDKIWAVIIGSAISASIYEILEPIIDTFFATFIAALAIEIFSEIMARITKTPAIVILLPSTIPLLPGGFLFYTMNNIISKNIKQAIYFSQKTIYVAFALAMSSVVMLICLSLIRRFTRH